MGDRDEILKILDRRDIFEPVLLPEDGIPAFPDQIENDLLLVLERWLVKMRFQYEKRLDELIYDTPRSFQRVQHILQWIEHGIAYQIKHSCVFCFWRLFFME